MTVVLCLAGGLVWGRCVLGEERHAALLQSGAVALDRALAGDGDAWAEVEQTYGRAARSSLLDSYPLWVLELAFAWRKGDAPRAEGPMGKVLARLRARDYAGAEAESAALEEASGRDMVARLVGDLRSARDQRRAAPLNSK